MAGATHQRQPATELWGPETRKAVENFPVSGERVPRPVVHWLGRIKARGGTSQRRARPPRPGAGGAHRDAADAVADGEHDDQFPIDVFQTGSGTSSHTNANEVIATLAGDGVHPSDHVNMGQSSNDVFPSAVHVAALGEVAPSFFPRSSTSGRRSPRRRRVRRRGEVRSHPPDGRRPVTLGQEFAGYAAQIRLARERIEPRRARWRRSRSAARRRARVSTPIPISPSTCGRLPRTTGSISAPAHPFEAQAARDGLVEVSGAMKVRRCRSPRLPTISLSSAPAPAPGLVSCPPGAAEGALDHAGQGEPGDPGGRPAGRGPGDRQRHRDHHGGHARATSS